MGKVSLGSSYLNGTSNIPFKMTKKLKGTTSEPMTDNCDTFFAVSQDKQT